MLLVLCIYMYAIKPRFTSDLAHTYFKIRAFYRQKFWYFLISFGIEFQTAESTEAMRIKCLAQRRNILMSGFELSTSVARNRHSNH